MAQQEHSELGKRALSFRFAFEGWLYVARSQRNAWIHALATVLVVMIAFWLGASTTDWALLVLAITIVWAAEMANTAVEAVVDLVSPEPQPLAKIAKDVAAGAVLVCAVGAAITGVLILGPPLWERLFG